MKVHVLTDKELQSLLQQQHESTKFKAIESVMYDSIDVTNANIDVAIRGLHYLDMVSVRTTNPIELGDEITIAGVVYKKEVEKKERVPGWYRVYLHCYWTIGQYFESGNWYVADTWFPEDSLKKIDEEQITFKS